MTNKKNDYRINAHGIDVADLKVGDWLVVEFKAMRHLGLLVGIEKRPKTYKGERCLDLMFHDDAGWFRMDELTNTQVIRIFSTVNNQSYIDIYKKYHRLILSKK